jgi:hypothetical protein
MPGSSGDVVLAFTVTDGTANLNSSANLVVKEPFLADVDAGFKMVQTNGSWAVQKFTETPGSNGALTDINEGPALQLNDGRGNNFINSYLPEGYQAVGFDADNVDGKWQFDLILRGDDPVTGDSVYRVQRFEDTGAALRNTSQISAVDVVMLETELHVDYSDTNNWRQVDINGDGLMGLDLEGSTLASSGVNKVIDAGSGLMLFEGTSTKDPASLENSRLLTSADGTNVFSLEGFKAAAITTDGAMTQVLFAGGTPASTSFVAQSFDDQGRAVGSSQIVASQTFNAAQEMGVAATTTQIQAEQAADPNFTSLVPDTNSSQLPSGSP